VIVEQQLFLENVYTEVQGKELVLATDHSCSLVLEKLLRASNDFQLRVFFDKFNGKYVQQHNRNPLPRLSP
jgi:nucleolar protein 9